MSPVLSFGKHFETCRGLNYRVHKPTKTSLLDRVGGTDRKQSGNCELMITDRRVAAADLSLLQLRLLSSLTCCSVIL